MTNHKWWVFSPVTSRKKECVGRLKFASRELGTFPGKKVRALIEAEQRRVPQPHNGLFE